MIKYIISIKTSFLTEEFFIKRQDKYNPEKHGIEKMRIELDNPTRNKLNRELKTFMANWCFIH